VPPIFKRTGWRLARGQSADFGGSHMKAHFILKQHGFLAFALERARNQHVANVSASSKRPAKCCERGRFLSRLVLVSADRVAQLDSGLSRGPMGKTDRHGVAGNNSGAKWTNRKHATKSICYEESTTAVACYLCNTRPKTVGSASFSVVPLLRVKGPSVIVMLRRRGASRGRLVLGGSLKSLAFMRECPKARSG
jgi:hypothetical protein